MTKGTAAKPGYYAKATQHGLTATIMILKDEGHDEDTCLRSVEVHRTKADRYLKYSQKAARWLNRGFTTEDVVESMPTNR